MRAGSMVMIAALLTLGTAAAAEPAKADRAQASPEPSRPAQIVLASAETAQGSAGAEQVATPAKRPRAARVTSCRCGDPQAQQQQ